MLCQTILIDNGQKEISSYLFTALGGHLGAAPPVAGVATHCRTTEQHNQTDGISPASATTATTAAAVSHDPKDSDCKRGGGGGGREFGCDVGCSLKVQMDFVTR